MITIRNIFCAIMLVSTASLFAMDANKEMKKAADEAYARTQVELALKRVNIPANLTLAQRKAACDNAVQVATIFGSPSKDPKDYDDFIILALKHEQEGLPKNWCGTCHPSESKEQSQRDDSKAE